MPVLRCALLRSHHQRHQHTPEETEGKARADAGGIGTHRWLGEVALTAFEASLFGVAVKGGGGDGILREGLVNLHCFVTSASQVSRVAVPSLLFCAHWVSLNLRRLFLNFVGAP